MKHFLLPICLFVLGILFACTNNDDTVEPTTFRLKMKVEYFDNVPTSKTIYNYSNNNVESKKSYSNAFESNIYYDHTTLESFTYSANNVKKTTTSYEGNMKIEARSTDIVFENGLMVQYGDEHYTYQNGLMIERYDSLQKTTYSYINNKPIEIISYSHSTSLNDFVPNYKLEFEYIDNMVRIIYSHYNPITTSWTIKEKTENYYTNNLCTQHYSFSYNGLSFVELSHEFKTYDSKGNLTRIDGAHQSFLYSTTYLNEYDEYGNLITVTLNQDWKTTYEYEPGKSNMNQLQPPKDYLFYLIGN